MQIFKFCVVILNVIVDNIDLIIKEFVYFNLLLDVNQLFIKIALILTNATVGYGKLPVLLITKNMLKLVHQKIHYSVHIIFRK